MERKEMDSEVNHKSLTEVEWSIMNVVWEKQPCAAGTVQETLMPTHGWAYSTIKTTMDRMVAKELLATEQVRNLTLYRSQIDRVSAQRNELQQCIRRAFHGTINPMLQFLVDDEILSQKDIDALRESLRAAHKRK